MQSYGYAAQPCPFTRAFIPCAIRIHHALSRRFLPSSNPCCRRPAAHCGDRRGVPRAVVCLSESIELALRRTHSWTHIPTLGQRAMASVHGRLRLRQLASHRSKRTRNDPFQPSANSARVVSKATAAATARFAPGEKANLGCYTPRHRWPKRLRPRLVRSIARAQASNVPSQI